MVICEFEDKEVEAKEKAEYIVDVDDQVVKLLLEGLIEGEDGDFVKDYIIGFFDDCGFGC